MRREDENKGEGYGEYKELSGGDDEVIELGPTDELPSTARHTTSSGYFQLFNNTMKRWWYADPNKTCAFISAELVKLVMSVGSSYGVVSYAHWDACGFPTNAEATTCDMDYDNLRILEIGAFIMLSMITVQLRQKRREHRLTPNTNMHRMLANKWGDDYAFPDLAGIAFALQAAALSEPSSAAGAAGGAASHRDDTDVNTQLEAMRAQLGLVDNMLDRVKGDIERYKDFDFTDSGYDAASNGLKFIVTGFLAFNLALQFVMMTASLSKDESVTWSETPLVDLGVIDWLAIGVAVLGALALMPDDITEQNDDIKQKLIRQYEKISTRALHVRDNIQSGLQICKRCLVDLPDGVDSAKVAELKETLERLKRKATLIEKPVEIYTEAGLVSAHRVAT